jgi:Plasmid pRiA4b ORF-3-like protein
MQYSPHMVLTLKIVLKDVRPQVWRRLRVPGSFTLAHLHDVLQTAMGWQDSHLHQFMVNRIGFTHLVPDEPPEMRDERQLRLSDLARRGKKFTYEYDFGDGWEHELVVEGVDADATDSAATCVDGKRACPPEDCGGPWGYMNLLKILANPRHREHGEMREWAGDFDPSDFDVAKINRTLLKRGAARVRNTSGAALSG